MKKSLIVASALMFALAATTSAAVIGNVALEGSSFLVPGGTVQLSGSCGVQGVTPDLMNKPAQIFVTQNGVSSAIVTATLDSNASFVSNVTIPGSFTSAPSILTAVCPNGNTLVTHIPAVVGLGNALTISGNTNLGSGITLSGVCGTNPSGSPVSFTITQNGVTSNLGTTLTTGFGGNFQGNVQLGSSLSAGPAVITATCPGVGNTITTSVNLVNSNPTTGNTNTGNTSSGSTSTTSSGTGSNSGVSATTTPTGGVAAGKAGLNLVEWLALALIVLGAVSMYVTRRQQVSLD